MKKIWIISTGGTIGSVPREDARTLHRESSESARQFLITQFAQSKSAYAKYADLLQNAHFPWEDTTLSESMTLAHWEKIVSFLAKLELQDCAGVILLHGTDTLAYTSALLALLLCDWEVPLFLVSGNRPPIDPLTNANGNFEAAVEWIWRGIAPNVYVTYGNADGKTRLYLGSQLLQSENFSEDFRGADPSLVFDLSVEPKEMILERCQQISQKRTPYPGVGVQTFGNASRRALLVRPYTALDYSVYDGVLSKEGKIGGVVHGSYHSGTVSFPGLVLTKESKEYRKKALALQQAGRWEEAKEMEVRAAELEARGHAQSTSSQSVWYLAKLCQKGEIPLFIAPSVLGKEQYETMHVVREQTDATLLNMTTEAAYAKLQIALSCGLPKREIPLYLQQAVNGEFLN